MPLAMERKRNPGKHLKNGFLAIFEVGFSFENPRTFTLRIDAPSMALCVLQKWHMFFWAVLQKKAAPEKKKNPSLALSANRRPALNRGRNHRLDGMHAVFRFLENDGLGAFKNFIRDLHAVNAELS